MTTGDLEPRALAALHSLVGGATSFREGQLMAIEALVRDRRRVLCVQRTGWGKSAVYFVATKLLRDDHAGPTLLVSPLLSLMRNQIEQAVRGGIRAVTINSDNKDEWAAIAERLDADDVDILVVSPERFANARFRDDVLPQVARRVGMFVIDEAHCISDWGHDFRPDYRRLARVIDLLPRGVPLLCTTATANDRVVSDVVAQLGNDLLVLRGPLDRESLALDVVPLPTQAQRLAWLSEALSKLDGCGIVYTLTVRDALVVSEWLNSRGIPAAAYFGAEHSDNKQEIEAKLKTNALKAVVATSALGMGYDKPDLAFVVHFQSPGSAIAYYQQVGRAGRALDRAVGVLLAGSEDESIQNWFINTAFPSREQADTVVSLLADAPDPLGITAIERTVNLRRTRLTNMLKVLEVEGAIERVDGKYIRTLKPWSYPAERVEQITAQRRLEQDRMRSYIATDGCLMEHLRRELDDPHAGPCGRCGWCVGAPIVDVAVDVLVAREAVGFLRGHAIDIEPRRQSADLKRIPVDRQVEAGKALCQLGDGGWGEQVKQQRTAGEYRDELVEAVATLARSWRPDPRPAWLTAVPSRRDPTAVDSLASRLAHRLGLPYHPLVQKVADRPAQNEMENSWQQFANVDGAFAIARPVPDGPVFLIDDLVDSRWTITVVGSLLRAAGAGPVFPLALARATGD